MASAGDGRARQDLILDLGFHRGEDTAYYLALGLNVVAVEADRRLVEQGRRRFAAAIATGRLHLLHAAVVGAEQQAIASDVLFFPHPQRSEWGSIDQRWVQRNQDVHGLPHAEPERVPSLCLPELVQRFGCPHHLKIDLEGSDEAVLRDLAQLTTLPRTISWETGKESLAAVLAQHQHVAALGYRRFRVVQQAGLERRAPALAADGALWHWWPGCSGALPERCDQPWRSLRWVLIQYRLLFLVYRLVGPRSGFRRLAHHPCRWLAAGPRAIQAWADRRGLPLPGWFDSHAQLGES